MKGGEDGAAGWAGALGAVGPPPPHAPPPNLLFFLKKKNQQYLLCAFDFCAGGNNSAWRGGRLGGGGFRAAGAGPCGWADAGMNEPGGMLGERGAMAAPKEFLRNLLGSVRLRDA